MITDPELYDEWQQEMLDEAIHDEMYEHDMRTDLDFFLEENSDIIDNINNALDALDNQLDHYGYHLTTDDFYELIKELR